jgi:hypothetical protein
MKICVLYGNNWIGLFNPLRDFRDNYQYVYSIYLNIYPNIYLNICLNICLRIYLIKNIKLLVLQLRLRPIALV